jgi:hypothetical protein
VLGRVGVVPRRSRARACRAGVAATSLWSTGPHAKVELGLSVHAPLPEPPCHCPALQVCARHTSTPRRPTNGRTAVHGLRPRTSLPPHCPCRALYCLPRLGVEAKFPTDSKLSYKSTSPSFTRGSTTPLGRHCRHLWCHNVPCAPAVFLPKPCYQYLS